MDVLQLRVQVWLMDGWQHVYAAGDMFLVVSGSSQPKIYDREGHELGEFVKGDMYIRDSTHTKGHQYRCCFGQWHPSEKCA